MLMKQKSPSLTTNMVFQTFRKLQIVFSKINLSYLIYSAAKRCCSLHLMRQNFLAKKFSKNANLDDLGISFSAFSSITNLKQINNSNTLKKPKKSKQTTIYQKHLALIVCW